MLRSQVDDQAEKVNNAIIESFEKLSESITQVENSTLESIEKVSKTLSDIKKAVAEVDQKEPKSNDMNNNPTNNVLFREHYEDLTKVMKSQQDSLENLIKNMKIQIDSKDVRDLQVSYVVIENMYSTTFPSMIPNEQRFWRSNVNTKQACLY